MSTIRIERLGGFAGYGGAHLRSVGECALSDLSASDQNIVERLFADKNSVTSRKSKAELRDGFTYRISRQTTDGTEAVDVPEGMVPQALAGKVKDSID